MDNRELAAVLAGLRLYGTGNDQDDAICDIADSLGGIEPLSPDEVDALCERLNTRPAAGAPLRPWFTLDMKAPANAGDTITGVGADAALIWSFEHNGWWAPGRQGYVSDVDAAGRYFLAEARQIVEIANIAAINEAIVLLPRNRVPAQRPTGTQEDRR